MPRVREILVQVQTPNIKVIIRHQVNHLLARSLFTLKIMATELEIKAAEQSDVPLLLALLKELAEAEKFPFEISVTKADLEQNLLGERPATEVLVFHLGKQPAGFAVFYHTFATTTGKKGLHLDDLYVRPQFQGNGIGKKVLGHLASLANERGCSRFEWWALKWNEKTIGFYENIGARSMRELRIFGCSKKIFGRSRTGWTNNVKSTPPQTNINSTIEVFSRRNASNVLPVLWTIGELEIPYVSHDIGRSFGGTETDSYQAMNPNARIPTIRDKRKIAEFKAQTEAALCILEAQLSN